MKFLYYSIAFIAIHLTTNLQAQHVIPVTSTTTIHNQPAATAQSVCNTTKKPRKFTQKTSITRRRSTLQKACLYTVYTIAALVGTVAIASFIGFAAVGFYIVCIVKLPFIL